MKSRLRLSEIRLRQIRSNSMIELTEICLYQGDTLCVAGLTGTGKSALARLLAGLTSDEEEICEFELTGQDGARCSELKRAQLIGYLPTQPQLCFSGIRDTVRGELELSLELLGEGDSARYSVDIESAIDALHLRPLLERAPFTLSGGESVRAALGVVLVKRPQFLVLDDCLHALDQTHAAVVVGLLHDMAASGEFGLVEFHTRIPKWSERFKSILVLGNSQYCFSPPSEVRATIASVSPYLATGDDRRAQTSNDCQRRGEATEARRIPNTAPPPCDNRLHAHCLSLTHTESDFTLGPLDLTVESGQSVALVGPNGAGKTTLLMCLGQLYRNYQGTVNLHLGGQSKIASPDRRRPYLWASHVLYAFQDPDNQLYLHTVYAELADVAARTGRTGISEKLHAIAESLGISAYLHDAPLDLPRAIRRLVALGALFVANPPVLLLDEPTAELDGEQTERLGELLRSYVEEGGMALFVSHDVAFIETNATDILRMERGIVRS